MPPAEPPTAEVDEVLEELRRARSEMEDAGRTAYMLDTLEDEAPGRFERRRWLIEAQVAERRCELWALSIAILESRCRALGVNPGGVL
jgi:hypothetical protein